MTDPKKPALDDLLSSFSLGPAWARNDASEQKERKPKRPAKSSDRFSRDNKRGDDRRDGGKFKGRGGKFNDRRDSPPRQEEAPPAEGIKVTLIPDVEAIRLIVKEVQQVARVYPLFDVAKILLAERQRCRAIFEAADSQGPLYLGKKDQSLFSTKEEANAHLWSSELKDEFIEEETIEVDPPKGNFQLVSKCGISGEWLGPPNFHNYQVNLRRIHREKFSNMPFERYSAKVKTERGEEAVNAWLETMTKKTRWRIKGANDEEWFVEQADAERALATQCFDTAFEETRSAELLASVSPKNLSPSLLSSLKLAGNHARRHPAMLIPAVCKVIEKEHLPVFKRKGKLFTGPVRPHPLPADIALAPRPAEMVAWIRANKPAKLAGLWKAVLPEGSTAPPADYAADLFWLLHQGHILLFTDDTLMVQEPRHDQAGEPGSGKKKKKKAKKAVSKEAGKAKPVEAGTEPEATAEVEVKEATAPEATAPEATAPEATAPEATAPEATAPEATAPEATAPEATAPEAPETPVEATPSEKKAPTPPTDASPTPESLPANEESDKPKS